MLNVFLEKLNSPNKNLEINIRKGTTSIGRKDADIIISSSSVSSLHCELHFSGTRVYLYDKNSTNGTYVNNTRIKKTALKDGDIISISGKEKSAVSLYKVNIVRELNKDRIIYIEKEPRRLKYFFYIAILVFLTVFIIWIMIPSSSEKLVQKIKIEKPWSNLESIPSVPYSIGVERVIFFNDSIFLPPNYTWLTSIEYKNIDDDGVYEARLYIVDIKNDMLDSKEDLKAILTVQRFSGSFIGSFEEEAINSFIWHETIFKKKNNLFSDFKYTKTSIGLWQWSKWEEGEIINLYAVCHTKRGRIILQASSFDSFFLDKFFHFIAQSYSEGFN